MAVMLDGGLNLVTTIRESKRGSQRRSFRRGGFNKLSALERAPQAPLRPRDLEGPRTRRDREKLEEILLTPSQRLYLWISGVRDAA